MQKDSKGGGRVGVIEDFCIGGGENPKSIKMEGSGEDITKSLLYC